MKSKLYIEMLAKVGTAGMARPMTFGEACNMIGAVQDGALTALKGQREAVEALAQRVIMLEAQAGYEACGTDKAGKPKVRPIGKRVV